MAPAVSPTPLLDRVQPVVRPRRRLLIPLLVGAAIGLLFEFFVYLFGLPDGVLLWAVAFVLMLFLGLLLHELGHLAAGKLAGFDFHQILVGPWMLSKESRGFKLRFLPARILACSGHTVMIPRTTVNLRRGFALFAAGGPAVTALMFLPLVFVPWGLAASCLLGANLVLAFFSWLPMTISGSHTDGKLLRTLAGTGPSSERLAAILYVMAIDNRGVEPRQWPREIVERLAAGAQSDPPGAARRSEFRGEAAVLLHIHAFDRGDAAAMAAALEQVLASASRLRPDLRRAYFGEAAFFQGVYRNAAGLARAWLDDARKVRGSVALKDWDAAPLAAIAIAEGNSVEARTQIGRAIARLDRQPGAHGSVLAAHRRLAALAASLADPLPAGASVAGSHPDR